MTSINISDSSVIQSIRKSLQLKDSLLREREIVLRKTNPEDSNRFSAVKKDIQNVIHLALLFSPRYKNAVVILDFDTLILLEKYLTE